MNFGRRARQPASRFEQIPHTCRTLSGYDTINSQDREPERCPQRLHSPGRGLWAPLTDLIPYRLRSGCEEVDGKALASCGAVICRVDRRGAYRIQTGAKCGQSPRAVDESFFVERVFPALHAVQCERCHSDNGVASETRLEFPESDAGRDQITAFGLSLMDLVDRRNPEQSLLLRKPTKRAKHTGGQRIKPGSDEENVLLSWINYLAGLSDEQVRQARERIARSDQRGLEALTVRRLTHSQYNHTVRDLLGDQTQPAEQLPQRGLCQRIQEPTGGTGNLTAPGGSLQQGGRATCPDGLSGRRPTRIDSPPARVADRCRGVNEFVRTFGLKAFRRPLTDSEVRQYSGLFLEEAGRTRNFYAGASMVVEAMLQSPHFLFRVERGARGPDAQFEIASRLSYFLWDTMPSDDLLRAAERGELATGKQIEAAARRMLADPRARDAMEEFLTQWMRFDRVLDATRDRRRFREFNAEVAAAMVEETRRLFNHLVWRDQNFMEFFTASYTFVNSSLARLYGLPAPDEEFAKVEYPADSGRSGVLGHGSFLVLTSKPAETSPTARGLFVRNHFLAQEIPPPPAGVNTVLPNLTERYADDKPATAGRPPEQRVVRGLSSPDRPHRAGFRAIQRDRRVPEEDGAPVFGSPRR